MVLDGLTDWPSRRRWTPSETMGRPASSPDTIAVSPVTRTRRTGWKAPGIPTHRAARRQSAAVVQDGTERHLHIGPGAGCRNADRHRRAEWGCSSITIEHVAGLEGAGLRVR